MRRTTLLIAAWLVFALAIRWHFSPAATPADPEVNYAAIRTQVQSLAISTHGVPDDEPGLTLKGLGVRELQFQRFDPTARVVVGVGEDGQPGVAGVDEGGNGKIDDRDELGATGSDDTFDVIAGELWVETERPSVESILSRGGWISMTDQTTATDQPQRCLVIGDRFEMMVPVASGTK